MSQSINVSVVGGGGHIGLPLSCFFQNKGHNTLIIDNNLDSINLIENGNIPFFEEALEENLKMALKNGMKITNDIKEIKSSDIVFVTIGTSSSLSTINLFNSLIDDVMDNIKLESTLILRSTVTINDIEYIKNNNNFENKNINLSYCPERIAEGRAFKELSELPQIVGVEKDSEYQNIKQFFSSLGIESIKTTTKESVFIKLFTNAYRHANFSLANEFSNIAYKNNLNFQKIINIAKENYPRLEHFPFTGYVGGPCLPKDLETFIKTFEVNNSLLEHLESINDEYLNNIVNKCLEIFVEKKVIQLGISFKNNSDDIRGSGGVELNKKLKKKGFEVYAVDPYIKENEQDIEIFEYENVKESTNNILIAVNHNEFLNYDLKNKTILYAEF